MAPNKAKLTDVSMDPKSRSTGRVTKEPGNLSGYLSAGSIDKSMTSSQDIFRDYKPGTQSARGKGRRRKKTTDRTPEPTVEKEGKSLALPEQDSLKDCNNQYHDGAKPYNEQETEDNVKDHTKPQSREGLIKEVETTSKDQFMKGDQSLNNAQSIGNCPDQVNVNPFDYSNYGQKKERQEFVPLRESLGSIAPIKEYDHVKPTVGADNFSYPANDALEPPDVHLLSDEQRATIHANMLILEQGCPLSNPQFHRMRLGNGPSAIRTALARTLEEERYVIEDETMNLDGEKETIDWSLIDTSLFKISNRDVIGVREAKMRRF